ncbi:MAG: SDR family NAD(P)-dependent oxidoreductase [Candidatus Velamenicoccus archaeovorus]
MDLQLANRSVIVTGGSRGIGACYVGAFLAAGARVAVADVNPPERGNGFDPSDVLFVPTDVADDASATSMAARVNDEFGEVDVLVNNAAVYQDIGRKVPFDEISVDAWDRVMRVNVRGVWQCTKAVTPSFRSKGRGKVVNVASTVAMFGSVGFLHYVASKAAVLGLTRSLARELGPFNITVNAVAPGLVSNDATRVMNDDAYLERMAQMRAIGREMVPDDLLGAVLFLASPASDFITGQTIVVDGGQILN